MKFRKSWKPHKLRRWQIGPPQSPTFRFFFTCARPGRTSDPGSKKAQVPDGVVHAWVKSLRYLGPSLAIVSLLGSKPDRQSEFSFYSFYGGFDSGLENPGRIHFQEWLNRWHGDMAIWVREHPTQDFARIEPEILDAIAFDINDLLTAGRTVVVMDSGGETRTGMVCRYMHAIEVTRSFGGKQTVRSMNIPARSVESQFGKVRGSGAPSPPGGSPGLGKK
jgi:hypothetical protein